MSNTKKLFCTLVVFVFIFLTQFNHIHSVRAATTCSLTIEATVPNILQGTDTAAFTFEISDPSGYYNDVTLNYAAGETFKSTTLTVPNPATYTVSEQSVAGWQTQPDKHVSLSEPTCSGTANFSNAIIEASVRVKSITIPAGGEAGWSFTLNGPGTPGETVATTGAGYLDFTHVLEEGIYTVTEQEQLTWDLTAVNGNPNATNCTFTVNYPADTNKTFSCDFENTKDVTPPMVTVNIIDFALTDADNSSLVTFEFSETAVGFTVSDLTVVGGTVSNFTQTDGDSYTATFTAHDNINITGSVAVNANSYSDLAGNNGASGSDTVIIFTVDQEPDNHPTNFMATTNSTSQITTSWTDATGSTIPANYLIFCSTSNSFTDPTDGSPQANDIDCADGTGVQNIASGTETAVWAGLTGGTQYFFKIFPYSNSGSDIDYKTDGTPATATTTVLNPDTDNDGINDNVDNCISTPNPNQANFDGDIYGDACDPDDDNDGVADEADICAETLMSNDAPPQPKKNRFFINDAGQFVDGNGNASGYTIADTAGCSSQQIIEEAGLGKGHSKFGLSRSELEVWITAQS